MANNAKAVAQRMNIERKANAKKEARLTEARRGAMEKGTARRRGKERCAANQKGWNR